MNILTLTSEVECRRHPRSRILEHKNLYSDQFLTGLFGICGLKNEVYYMCSVASIQWLNNKVVELFVLQ